MSLDAQFGKTGGAAKRRPSPRSAATRSRRSSGSRPAPPVSPRALRERRVAERVLARSTREDLRRRVDLGLVVDFMADASTVRAAPRRGRVAARAAHGRPARRAASGQRERGPRLHSGRTGAEVFESAGARRGLRGRGRAGGDQRPPIADDLLGDVLASLATLEPVESVSAEGASPLRSGLSCEVRSPWARPSAPAPWSRGPISRPD